MSFLKGFILTAGLLIIGSIINTIIPSIYNSILGNAVVIGGIFVGYIYFILKQSKYKKRLLFPDDDYDSNVVWLAFSFLVSIYLITWCIFEIEIIIKKGPELYLEAAEEIFAISPNRKLFLTILLVSPIVEEFYYRGLLQSSFQEKYDQKKAIIYSSLLFGVSHIRFGDSFFSTIIYSMLIGLVFGWVFQKTRNIKATIVLHFFWNFLGYLFPFIMYNTGLVIDKMIKLWIFIIVMLLISIVIIIFGIIKFKSLNVKNYEQS